MILHYTLMMFFIFETISQGECKIYFREDFSDGHKWQERWIHSKTPKIGKFSLRPEIPIEDNLHQGIQTSEDNKYYALSTKFEPFSNKGKTLVLQFSVKQKESQLCAGEYIKIFDCTLDPISFDKHTPYLLMFGPDKCLPVAPKVHFIIKYGNNLIPLNKQIIGYRSDETTRLLTLIIKPDDTYSIKQDNVEVMQGKLSEDLRFAALGKKRFKAYLNGTLKTGYEYSEICGIGFDLWQVQPGTVFDNILLSDDENEAEEVAWKTWGKIREKEKETKREKYKMHQEL